MAQKRVPHAEPLGRQMGIGGAAAKAEAFRARLAGRYGDDLSAILHQRFIAGRRRDTIPTS